MPDLGHTDAEWDRWLGRELASTQLAAIRLLKEIEHRFRREREQCWVARDTSGFMASTGCTFSGANPGSNATKEGRVYVRITGAGPYTVSVYKATGGGAGDKVAEGSGNASSTVTLAAQNSSGLTGTWDLPASVSTTSGDELSVLICQDFKARLPKVYTQTDGVEDDADSRAVLSDLYTATANALKSARQAFVAGLSRLQLSNGQDNPKARGNEFLNSAKTALQSDDPDPDGSGTVDRVRDGLFERAAAAMADETTGSTQGVVKRIPSAGAGVFSGDNDGLGAVASHTPGQACPASVWTFRCDDDTIGSEHFSVEINWTDGGEERIERIQDGPTVGKSWSGPYEFGPITVTRTLTKTGDSSDLIFAAASAASVSGETSSNTDDGVLHWKTEANGSNWDVSFYSSSSLSSSSLVAKATNVAASASFTASEQNSSGLSVSWQLGGTPSAANGTLKLNPFRVQNANQTADEFSVTVTVASNPGLIQTILAEEIPNGAALNGVASGSETIPDDYVKQGTFFPFAVQDN